MHLLFTITATHIGRLRGLSYKTARTECQAIRDSLKLEKGQPLYLRDVAKYYELPALDVAKTLYFSNNKLYPNLEKAA